MIRIENISKAFEGNEVFKNLSLDIKEGESIAIIGQSGVGKSVLLKLICGLIPPDSGTIYINNVNIQTAARREREEALRKIAMLFQGSALFDSLTVEENVGFFLYEHSTYSRDKIREIVKEKLSLVNLVNIESLLPAEISGGMQKRVSLARALAKDPEILLYDEPTTGLDPVNAELINDLILETMKSTRVTSIIVTHDMHSAFKIADRIAMLYHGEIIAVEEKNKFKSLDNPIIQQFITGSSEGPITRSGQKELQAKGVEK